MHEAHQSKSKSLTTPLDMGVKKENNALPTIAQGQQSPAWDQDMV
jgi:hypothetical protein